MHNMCVSDRVMSGDVNALYNPEASLEEGVPDTGSIHMPYDMEYVLKRVHGDDVAETIAVVEGKCCKEASMEQSD